MNETIPQLLKTLPRSIATPGLEEQVISRIRERIRARTRMRMIQFGIGTAIGIGGIARLGAYLVHAVSQSGFASYASLLLSGDSAVLRLWKELGLALFESLPLFGVIGALAMLAFLIWTAANALSNVRKYSSYLSA